MRLPDILTRAIVTLHDTEERFMANPDFSPAGDAAYRDLIDAKHAVLAAARLCAPAIVAARDEAERRRRDTIAEDEADERDDLRRTA